jgi:hypothetical protein
VDGLAIPFDRAVLYRGGLGDPQLRPGVRFTLLLMQCWMHLQHRIAVGTQASASRPGSSFAGRLILVDTRCAVSRPGSNRRATLRIVSRPDSSGSSR